MRFKIRNELKRTEYRRVAEFLRNRADVLELFSGVDLEFISVGPITVATEGFGHKLCAEVLFAEKIGFEVCDSLRLDSETHVNFMINRKNFRLSKVVMEPEDLERGLNVILKAIVRVVNHVCTMYDKQIQRLIILDSESLDRQVEMILEREELKKRGEISIPFGTIHSNGSRDAKERAGGLIPLYKEYDKTYLYDAKRVYYLLSHDFVNCLLRCDGETMVRKEEFDNRGEAVLRDLVYKKFLKKHKMLDGTVCYYGLNEKTRRYLTKHLKRRTPRS